jgi:hypothetical protein
MQPERTWSEGNLDMLEQRTVFEVPRYVVALVSHAQAKIARVYWGSFKTAWDGATDPQIEGVGWSVDTNPDPKKNRTHLSFERVELQWNRLNTSEMSANVAWTPDQWRAWFDRLMVRIDN